MSALTRRLVTSVALGVAEAAPGPIASLAGRAEAAGADMIVLGAAGARLDPLVTAGWLAPRLKRTALVAVLPALHSAPFHVARALSALDFLTKGRAGWAPATLGHAAQAHATEAQSARPGDEVLPKAVDFIDAACALWDSWDADALIIDKAAGLYLHPGRVRRVNYRGRYFQVMGPLNAARPPQGYPVLVQSDADPLWRALAGRADVLLVDRPSDAGLSALRREIAEAGGQARLLAKVDLEDQQTAGERAAQLESWLERGLADGLHAAPSDARAQAALLDALLPELARRGLLEPAGDPAGDNASLRARLGLPKPMSLYEQARPALAERV